MNFTYSTQATFFNLPEPGENKTPTQNVLTVMEKLKTFYHGKFRFDTKLIMVAAMGDLITPQLTNREVDVNDLLVEYGKGYSEELKQLIKLQLRADGSNFIAPLSMRMFSHIHKCNGVIPDSITSILMDRSGLYNHPLNNLQFGGADVETGFVILYLPLLDEFFIADEDTYTLDFNHARSAYLGRYADGLVQNKPQDKIAESVITDVNPGKSKVEITRINNLGDTILEAIEKEDIEKHLHKIKNAANSTRLQGLVNTMTKNPARLTSIIFVWFEGLGGLLSGVRAGDKFTQYVSAKKTPDYITLVTEKYGSEKVIMGYTPSIGNDSED